MTGFIDCAIDVSDAQGADIDWPAVAADGITTVMIKATEGHSFEAKTFVKNRERALATGLITVIPYDFLRPGYEAESLAFFIKVAGLGSGSQAALDWEGRAADTADPQEAEDIGEGIRAVTGRPPLGYWGIPGSTPRPPTNKMVTWPRWVPRYPRTGPVWSFGKLPQSIQSNPSATWPNALFAQYTSTGQVRGIKGPVDRSIWIGTEAELRAWHATGAMPVGF